MKCEKCLYRANCQFLAKHKGAEVEGCTAFKDATDFVEVETVEEQIIRKKSEVSDYWQNCVRNYRALQSYSLIEHEVDTFLRGYNEAVDDMLAILYGNQKDGEKV